MLGLKSIFYIVIKSHCNKITAGYGNIIGVPFSEFRQIHETVLAQPDLLRQHVCPIVFAIHYKLHRNALRCEFQAEPVSEPHDHAVLGLRMVKKRIIGYQDPVLAGTHAEKRCTLVEFELVRLFVLHPCGISPAAYILKRNI